MKTVLLLGASGSIGTQTLDIIRDNPNDFKLVAFSVGNHHEKIDEILKNHQEVHSIYLINELKAIEYKAKYPQIKFYAGEGGLAKLTRNADYEMCVEALVGIAGLEPATIALERDKILCLANKEALVTGGHIINAILKSGKGKLYPIDSEHVALAKCLAKVKPEEVVERARSYIDSAIFRRKKYNFVTNIINCIFIAVFDCLAKFIKK